MSSANLNPDEDVPEFFKKAYPSGFLSRLKQWFLVRIIHLVGWLLRRVVRIRKSFVLPCTGILIVTGFDLVQEVFARDKDFPTSNDNKAIAAKWDPPYLLALPKNNEHFKNMHKQTREIFSDPDLLKQLPDIAAKSFTDLLPDPDDGNDWRDVDIGWGYMYPGFLTIVDKYYGVSIRDEDAVEFVCALIIVSGFFFGSAKTTTNESVLLNVQTAFARASKLVEDRIEEAKIFPDGAKGALKIAVHHADFLLPDNNPNKLRVDQLTSYFLGMIMGFIPTNGNGHARITEELFGNPMAMYWAKHYGIPTPGQANDPDRDGEFLAVLHECLRMNYILPGLFRKADGTDLILGRSTERPQAVESGTAILVSTMAAMFDTAHIDKPFEFRPDRSYWGYLNYGHKMHFCVGWDISNIIMIEYYRALIIRGFELKPGGKQVSRGMFPWQIDVHYRKPTEGVT